MFIRHFERTSFKNIYLCVDALMMVLSLLDIVHLILYELQNMNYKQNTVIAILLYVFKNEVKEELVILSLSLRYY